MIDPTNIIAGTVVRIGLGFNGLTGCQDIADEYAGQTGEVTDVLDDGSYNVEIQGYGEVNFGSHMRFASAWNPTSDPAVEDIFRDELEDALRRAMGDR